MPEPASSGVPTRHRLLTQALRIRLSDWPFGSLGMRPWPVRRSRRGGGSPPGAVKLIELGGHQIALANVDGNFYAVDSKPPSREVAHEGKVKSTPTGASGHWNVRRTPASSMSAPGRSSTHPLPTGSEPI